MGESGEDEGGEVGAVGGGEEEAPGEGEEGEAEGGGGGDAEVTGSKVCLISRYHIFLSKENGIILCEYKKNALKPQTRTAAISPITITGIR